MFGSDPVNSTQLSLALDWGREPWNGFCPRSLARCNSSLRIVDNSDTLAEAARRVEIGEPPDPAQLTLFLKGNPYGSSS